MGDKGHFLISVIKSTVRIIGFTLAINNLAIGLIVLILAEALGILQEVVDKR